MSLPVRCPSQLLARAPITLRFYVASALGSVPASWVVSRQAQRVRTEHLQRAFGLLLVTFSIWFVTYRLYFK